MVLHMVDQHFSQVGTQPLCSLGSTIRYGGIALSICESHRLLAGSQVACTGCSVSVCLKISMDLNSRMAKTR